MSTSQPASGAPAQLPPRERETQAPTSIKSIRKSFNVKFQMERFKQRLTWDTELWWDETIVDVVFFKESIEDGDHSI